MNPQCETIADKIIWIPNVKPLLVRSYESPVWYHCWSDHMNQQCCAIATISMPHWFKMPVNITYLTHCLPNGWLQQCCLMASLLQKGGSISVPMADYSSQMGDLLPKGWLSFKSLTCYQMADFLPKDWLATKWATCYQKTDLLPKDWFATKWLTCHEKGDLLPNGWLATKVK